MASATLVAALALVAVITGQVVALFFGSWAGTGTLVVAAIVFLAWAIDERKTEAV